MLGKYEHGKYKIQLYNYENGQKKYTFEMLDENNNPLCLISLWALRDKFILDSGETIHNQHDLFSNEDYYQEDIQSFCPKRGFCRALTDFIIEKIKTKELPFSIKSVYSSQILLPGGEVFWQKQVEIGLAEYIPELNRYKLIIEVK